MDAIALVARWMHIGSAIAVVGGSLFMRCVLMPAARDLPAAEHDALRGRIMQRWKMIVHTAILLFLLSGFYNYLVIAIPQHRGDKLYNALIGIKILIAFVVFFIAIALTGRSAATEMFRRDAKKWLTINLVLAGLIVGISGFLKLRPAVERPHPAATAGEVETNAADPN